MYRRPRAQTKRSCRWVNQRHSPGLCLVIVIRLVSSAKVYLGVDLIYSCASTLHGMYILRGIGTPHGLVN